MDKIKYNKDIGLVDPVMIAGWPGMGSVALGATLTTSVVLLALGVAPVCVMLLIGFGAPPPTVAELLYAVDTNDGRS